MYDGTRSAAYLVGEKPGCGCPEDHLCRKCLKWYLVHFGILRLNCDVCGCDVSEDKTYTVYPQHRPFLPPDKRGAQFFCRLCYDRAREKMAEQGCVVANSAVGETRESGKFPAQMEVSGAAVECPVGGAPAPKFSEVMGAAGPQRIRAGPAQSNEEACDAHVELGESGAPGESPFGAAGDHSFGKVVDLPGMLHRFVNHRFTGNALTEINAYEEHINSVAGGLFSTFLSALPDCSSEAKVKVAMLLELFGHLVDPTYSQTVWELTMFLHSCGVSDRDLRGLSAKGLAMCSSKLTEHEKNMSDVHMHRIGEEVMDPEFRALLVTDDFHQIEGAHGTPRKDKKAEDNEVPAKKKHPRFSTAHHVANAIVKRLGKNGPDIPVRLYPECLTPRAFSVTAVLQWVEEHWGESCKTFYHGTRLKFLEKISATLHPYSTLESDATWDNPITMENVTFLRCFPNAFKDPADMDLVFSTSCKDLGPLLERQHIIATSDFYPYINLISRVLTDEARYGHVIPIPGAFHVGLNAQDGVFSHYRPVVDRIWGAVFPKKRLDPNPSPLERKFALELLCEGWKKCRTHCLGLLSNLDKISWEAIFLTQLFEEHLPISLDTYPIFLSGDMDLYQAILLRLLRMFIQLGKCNYVLCISVFVAQLMHWKMHFRPLYDHLCKELRYCSEEEIEIFHSMIREHVRGRKTVEQVVREVSAWGANMKTLRSWKHPHGHKSHRRRKASQLTPEVVLESCRAIKALFASVVTARSYCVPAEKLNHWESPVLGTFGDHLLPYALQHASVRLKGCSGIRHEDREDSQGFVDPSCRGLCGHARTGGTFCSECMSSTTQVVREMMTQYTIGGIHIA